LKKVSGANALAFFCSVSDDEKKSFYDIETCSGNTRHSSNALKLKMGQILDFLFPFYFLHSRTGGKIKAITNEG
jgi:hypothetical protein